MAYSMLSRDYMPRVTAYSHLDSLAMVEMTTLVAALYRRYTTSTTDDFDTTSPGITSRFEIFYDETCSQVRVCFRILARHDRLLTIVQEHECMIEFNTGFANLSDNSP